MRILAQSAEFVIPVSSLTKGISAFSAVPKPSKGAISLPGMTLARASRTAQVARTKPYTSSAILWLLPSVFVPVQEVKVQSIDYPPLRYPFYFCVSPRRFAKFSCPWPFNSSKFRIFPVNWPFFCRFSCALDSFPRYQRRRLCAA